MSSALRAVLPESANIAVIHSSFPKLMPPAGFTPWDALYALRGLVREGWTVALPAFTFSFCGGTDYDGAKSPSETGLFADWLLSRFPESLRTPHPIYSFAVVGPRAAQIAACPSSTTFGEDSPFGLFERENAALVMLGCGWEYCTQTHRYEEVAGVPYRFFKDFEGTANFGDGAEVTEARMFVRDLDVDARNDLSLIVPALEREGMIVTRPLFRGQVQAASARDVAAVSLLALKSDPYALVKNAPRVRQMVAAKREALSQPPVRLAVLGSANMHFLEEACRADLAALLPERRIELAPLGFGQMRQEIIRPDSELNGFEPQFRVFCERIEDLGSIDDPEALFSAAERYAGLIERLHRAHSGWTIVHRLAVLRPSSLSDEARTAADLVAQLNARLDERLSGLDQLVWVDTAAEAADARGSVLDARLTAIGRFPFSEEFSRKLARRWAGLILAALGKTARLIVLDLDNTCWGGVLGEDGLEGIRIGGDHPGSAFAEFQHVLKRLAGRGVALAIASKNDEDLALRAFAELPAMVLRPDDFVAHRINWNPKWANIRELAEDLNLGLGSVLFVDDNPVEREQVRLNVPEVKILELPSDPAEYAGALAASPYLASVGLTAEDSNRANSFKRRAHFREQVEAAESLEDFYAGLGMQLHLRPLDTGNAQRAAQLCQKTNQFNSTTRRYDLQELQRLQDDGADVVVIGLEDRHSQFENIGLIILKPDEEGGGEIDLFLLSCRVLGRGIETVVPRWAIGRSAARGWSHLSAPIIETERNTPVRRVYADAGFASVGENRWRAECDLSPEPPRWLNIRDRFVAEAVS